MHNNGSFQVVLCFLSQRLTDVCVSMTAGPGRRHSSCRSRSIGRQSHLKAHDSGAPV